MDSTEHTPTKIQPSGRRLTLDGKLQFECRPGLSCFTACCRDVNIFLTPYDILRMKRRLGVSSEAFLERYTLSLVPESTGFPVVVLKMREDSKKTCPFVGPGGCAIYEDRPWSCRMYPLDRAAAEGEEYRLIADSTVCLGMKEGRERTLREYLHAQGIDPYEEMEGPLRKITSDPRLSKEKIQNPKIREMCRMTLYDLDRFKRFVFESRFLEIFHVDKDEAERIKEDDLALLKFAYRWLEFGLVAGETFKIREDLLKGKAVKGAHRRNG